MRASTVFVVVLLVLTGLAGFAPSLANAQEGGGETDIFSRDPGTGVTYERLDEQEAIAQLIEQLGDNLELYRFTFEESSYLPDDRYPEAMMVLVSQGPFVLFVSAETDEGDVVAFSTDGRPVYINRWSSPTTIEEEELCPSPCSVPPDSYAYLDTGDYAIHGENSFCAYCNESAVSSGVLTVLPVTTTDGDFSWRSVENVAPGAPSASGDSGTPIAHRMSWRLIPGPACGGRFS